MEKLLLSRKEAADCLSISLRGLDYMIGDRKLTTRRIGARVLIPAAELKRFVRAEHPEPLKAP